MLETPSIVLEIAYFLGKTLPIVLEKKSIVLEVAYFLGKITFSLTRLIWSLTRLVPLQP